MTTQHYVRQQQVMCLVPKPSIAKEATFSLTLVSLPVDSIAQIHKI